MTENKRTKAPLNDFGKAVQHYLIYTDKTLKDLVDGFDYLTESQMRGLMTGDKKPPMDWVLLEELPPFMADHACACHGDQINALYEAFTANRDRNAPVPMMPAGRHQAGDAAE